MEITQRDQGCLLEVILSTEARVGYPDGIICLPPPVETGSEINEIIVLMLHPSVARYFTNSAYYTELCLQICGRPLVVRPVHSPTPRHGRIAVLSRTEEGYRPYFEKDFERDSIPHFIPREQV